MKWFFAIINWIFFRRRCFFCDKLVDINCNIIQYKTSDHATKLQYAYVCSDCSPKLFMEKQLADKLKILYDGMSDDEKEPGIEQ